MYLYRARINAGGRSMQHVENFLKLTRPTLFAGVLLIAGTSLAQQKTIPDAQVEANVLRALAGAPQLASQSIKTSTIYGTVTLSGVVQDESTRVLAETLASKADGVQKVVDELTLGTPDVAQVSAQNGDPNANQQPYAQSNSQPDGSNNGNPSQQQSAPYQGNAAPMPPPPGGGQAGPPPDYGNQPSSQNQQQPYGAPGRQPLSQNGQQPYGRQPYYGQQAEPYGAQRAGVPVTVGAGSLLRVRINQGLDSKHTQVGTPFDAVVLNDVVADGEVAIPRGATVHGTVVESKSAGALKGRGELALQLNQVVLAGKTFPLVSDTWANNGADKTARTVNNAVGLGALGAIIGAVAGGGAGAAIGAGVGGAAGIGTSAASGGGQAFIPSEAILTFHLAQPAPVTTVSQSEMDRLGYGVPAGAQPRVIRRSPYGPNYGPYGGYPAPY
jgi:hypothetical protein